MRARTPRANASDCTHLPDERLDATGTTVGLVKSDLTNHLVAIVPAITISFELLVEHRNEVESAEDLLAELLDLLDLGGQVVGEGILKGLSEEVS